MPIFRGLILYVSSHQSAINNEAEVSAISLERKAFEQIEVNSNTVKAKYRTFEYSSPCSTVTCSIIALTNTLIQKVIVHISIS